MGFVNILTDNMVHVKKKLGIVDRESGRLYNQIYA